MSRTARLATVCSVIALMSGTGLSAGAQEDTSTTGDEKVVFDKVTVTATKREQTLQEIPVSVSVVDAKVIDESQIFDLVDLQSVVPSLRVTVGQSPANTSFIIRGFGNGGQGIGIEPSVGVFVDGVYRSRAAAQLADLPDVQRVEVLRGPQSTLFGKNASAGVINIVTAAPQFEPGGSADVTVGNDSLFGFKGSYTAPINDQWAFSLSGSIRQADGWATNLGTGSDINEVNRWSMRGQLLWEPSSTLSARLIIDADSIDETCCLINNIIAQPVPGLGGATAEQIVQALGGQAITNNPTTDRYFADIDPVADISNQGISLQIDKQFGDLLLTSITAYREQDRYDSFDGDFSTLSIFGAFETEADFATTTQELRLQRDGDRIDWMLGAFYFDETVNAKGSATFGSDAFSFFNLQSGGALQQLATALPLIGITDPIFADGQINSERFHQSDQAISIFGQVDFALTDRLELSLGANYTEDKKRVSAVHTSDETFGKLNLIDVSTRLVTLQTVAQALAAFGIDASNPAQVQAFATNNPMAFAQIQANAASVANQVVGEDIAALQAGNFGAIRTPIGMVALQNSITPTFVDFPNNVEDGRSDDENVTWSAKISYELTDNVNLFASASTGFKATSWELSRRSLPAASDMPALIAAGIVTDPFPDTGSRRAGPEETKLYEIGLKATLPRGAIYVTAFDQSIENFQTSIILGQSGIVLANAGELSVQGLEIEGFYSPINGLDLSFMATFLDPEYTSFPNSPFGDLSGTAPPNIHETSLVLGARYGFELRPGLRAFVRADYDYSSPVDVVPDPAIKYEREPSILNASFGIKTASDWTLQVWGRNITEDDSIRSAGTGVLPGSIIGSRQPTTSYGLTVSKAF